MPVHRFLFIIVLFVLNLLALAAILVSLGQPEPKGEPERISNQINPDRLLLQPAGDEGAAPQSVEAPAEATSPSDPVAASTPTGDPTPRPDGPPAPARAPDVGAAPPADVAPAAQLVPAADPGPIAGGSESALTTDAPPPPIPGPIEADARAAPAAATGTAEGEGAPVPIPEACVTYASLTQVQADALEAVVATHPGLHTERDSADAPTAWWVRLPAAGSREAAERKVRELRDQGVTDFFIFRDPGPNQFAISLGLFKTEGAARHHQAFLERKRIKGVVVSPRNGVLHSLQVRGPTGILDAVNRVFAASHPGTTLAECPP